MRLYEFANITYIGVSVEPEEGITSPGAGVTGRCETHDMDPRNQIRTLQDQQALTPE